MAYVYLNGPTLATSTAVYQDSNLSIPAPDGYYSNGTIVRQWLAGVLLPPQSCPSCAQPCGGAITANGGQGVYNLSIDLGTDTGAIMIGFNPQSVPDGIIVDYDGVLYNELSSPVYGYLAGTPNLPTFVGYVGADSGLVANSPHTVGVFNYVPGSGFPTTPNGGTTSVTVLPGQLALTAGPPAPNPSPPPYPGYIEYCTMVIPKPNATPSTLNISIFGLLNSTVFQIKVSCPTPLQTVMGSRINGEPDCVASIDQTYYTSVAPADILNNTKYLYAYIFTDINGEFPLAAGNYTIRIGITDQYTIHVDSHGIITSMNLCP